jgi:hypothetical protein
MDTGGKWLVKEVVLTGRKEIQNFCKRSWDTILDWIRKRGFPAAKVDGVWEADAHAIIEWRRKIIAEEKACQDKR